MDQETYDQVHVLFADKSDDWVDGYARGVREAAQDLMDETENTIMETLADSVMIFEYLVQRGIKEATAK